MANLELLVQVQDRELQQLRKDVRTLSREMGGISTSTRGAATSYSKFSSSASKGNHELDRTVRGAIAGSGAFRGLGRAIAFASGAYLGAAGFTSIVRGAYEELQKQGAVAAQTNSVLKSTKGIAGVTADEVNRLSKSLEHKTGIDDEAIKSSENLLLTFTNIRHVVGQNNDVFARASKAALDLSVRFHKDLNQSAVVLGRALQDPIGGLTTLSRIGVRFSDSQKATIKALVASGNVLGAQKLILAEVEKRAQGAAAAYGRTLPGEIDKARESFKDLSANALKPLVPDLSAAAAEAAKFFQKPANERELRDAVRAAADAFKSVAGTIGTAKDLLGGWRNTIQLLLALKVASAVSKWAGSIGLFSTKIGKDGGEGALGRSTLLLGRLKNLAKIGIITIGIELLLDDRTRGIIDRILNNKQDGGATPPVPGQSPVPPDQRKSRQLAPPERRRLEREAKKNPRLAELVAFFKQQRNKGLSWEEIYALPKVAAIDNDELLANARALVEDQEARNPRVRNNRTGARKSGGPAGTAFAALEPGHRRLLQGGHVTAGLPQFGGGKTALDIAAKPGDAVLAPENGKLSRITGHPPSEGSQGSAGVLGYSLYFEGDSGTVWYMTHLAAVAPVGRYKRGDRIAIVAYHPRGTHLHIDHSTLGSAHQVAELPSTQPPLLGRGRGRGAAPPTSGSEPSPLTLSGVFATSAGVAIRRELAGAQGTTNKRELKALLDEQRFLEQALKQAGTNGKLRTQILEKLGQVRSQIQSKRHDITGSGASDLLPKAIRANIATAEGTLNTTKDDVKAWQRALTFLTKLQGSVTKGSEKWIEIQTAINDAKQKLAGLRGKSDKPVISTELQTQLTVAQRETGTKGLRDQLAVLQQIRKELRAELGPNVTADKRLEIQSNLTDIAGQIKQVKDGLKQAGAAAAAFQQALSATRADAKTALGAAQALPQGTTVNITDEFGRITKTIGRNEIVAHIAKIKKELANVADEKTRAKLQADLEKWKGILHDAFGDVLSNNPAQKAFERSWEDVTNGLLGAFDDATQTLIDGVNAQFDKLTPAEQALAGLQAQDRAESRQSLVDAVTKAQARADRATGKRKPKADQDLADAQRALQEFDLEPLAEGERKAREAQRTVALKELEKTRAAARTALEREIEDAYEIFSKGGKTAGDAFAQGLVDAFPEFKKAWQTYVDWARKNGVLPPEAPATSTTAPHPVGFGKGPQVDASSPAPVVHLNVGTIIGSDLTQAAADLTPALVEELAKYNRRNGRQLQ